MAVPSTPTSNRIAPVSPSPVTPRAYNPAIRGSPGGVGRSTMPVSAPAAIPRGLLWPNAQGRQLLGLKAAAAWEQLRRNHGIDTTSADHAAARARQDHFCIDDGEDDRRNAGGFDPDSYEKNDEQRKKDCALAYDDLRRAAIALDRVTDSQTWVISFRPEAHPDNVVPFVKDPSVQRVRNALLLKVPLFHVPAALQCRGTTLPEWRADVQELKNHMRRVFAAPHVETYAVRRKAAGLRGALAGTKDLLVCSDGPGPKLRVPAQVSRLGLDEDVADQVLQILAHMPIEEAFAALILVHHIAGRDAVDLIQAKLDDEDDGL
ncbi:hypothetical protein AURDEDRAFT_129700 [Auricularia subglabra TFB-10046 SS5]|nr:hypothetical protein AURDEDRAFT_129700 [Auricularia subglabra TFB-10046 SS5]